MTAFVFTPRGWVNLDRVDIAKHKKNGRHGIVVDGEEIDDNYIGFGETVVSMVPPQGDWECLMPCHEEDGSFSLAAEPVLAWGLDCMGSLKPITPSDASGVEGNYALRKVGQTRVNGGANIGGFASADEWLSSLQSPPNLKLVP